LSGIGGDLFDFLHTGEGEFRFLSTEVSGIGSLFCAGGGLSSILSDLGHSFGYSGNRFDSLADAGRLFSGAFGEVIDNTGELFDRLGGFLGVVGLFLSALGHLLAAGCDLLS